MSAGHTPGPWAAEPDFSGRIHIVLASDERRWRGEPIASLEKHSHGVRTVNVQTANARLIAAAPDLLAALKDAVEEIEDLRRYANNHGGMIDDEECGYARAAIARATGAA